MQTKSRNEPAGSPVPGVIPPPTGVEHDPTPTTGEPDAGREARRTARDERHGAPAARSGVMIPNRRKRLPLEAPLMRLVASAGIVAIGVVIAAIMTSQDSEGWLIGLVVSIVSLVLAALLWSSRRL
jgi:hypothetical protein